MTEHDQGGDPYAGQDVGAPEPGGLAPTPEERTAAVWAHLLGGIGLLVGFSFVGPLVIWLVKKDESAFVEDQAREALNFHLVVFVALLVSSAMLLCVVGIVVLPVVWILGIVLSIVGAMKANEGVRYRYPWIFRIVN